MKIRQHEGLRKLLTLAQRYPAPVMLGAMGVGGFLVYLFLWPDMPVQPRHAQRQTPPPMQQGISGLRLEKASEDANLLTLQKDNEAVKKQLTETKTALEKMTQQQTQREQVAKERETRQSELVVATMHKMQTEFDQHMQTAIQKATQEGAAAARAAQPAAKKETPKPMLPTLIRQVPEPQPRPGVERQGEKPKLMRSANATSLAGSPPPLNRVDTPYLSIGSIAPIRVVTGVPATSRENGAIPIALVVTGPFRPPYQLHGPGRNSTPTEVTMHGCMFMGKGQANMASGRVEVELETLSCVMPNLMAYEREVRGYVVGRDARFGLPGYVESHEAAQLTKVAITSALAGAAEAFRLAKQTVVVTPFGGTINTTTGNYGEVAGFSALSNAAAQLSAFYLRQAERLLPTIVVDAGAVGAAVLQEPLLLEDFPTRMLVTMR